VNGTEDFLPDIDTHLAERFRQFEPEIEFFQHLRIGLYFSHNSTVKGLHHERHE